VRLTFTINIMHINVKIFTNFKIYSYLRKVKLKKEMNGGSCIITNPSKDNNLWQSNAPKATWPTILSFQPLLSPYIIQHTSFVLYFIHCFVDKSYVTLSTSFFLLSMCSSLPATIISNPTLLTLYNNQPSQW